MNFFDFFFFNFLGRILLSCYVAQTGFELLGSRDSPASAFCSCEYRHVPQHPDGRFKDISGIAYLKENMFPGQNASSVSVLWYITRKTARYPNVFSSYRPWVIPPCC
jgi:hypothetical protein